jgi:hypothetical protein
MVKNNLDEAKKVEKMLVGKNVHSVYMHCNKCQTWGIGMPLDRICGNCGSSDTVKYYDLETISSLYQKGIKEGEEIGKNKYIYRHQVVPINEVAERLRKAREVGEKRAFKNLCVIKDGEIYWNETMARLYQEEFLKELSNK